jgi:hypothetical protein
VVGKKYSFTKFSQGFFLMIKHRRLMAAIFIASSSLSTVLAADFNQHVASLREGRALAAQDLEFLRTEIRTRLADAKRAGDREAVLELYEVLELVVAQRDRDKKIEERRATADENRVWRACYKQSSTDNYEAIEKGLLIATFVAFAVPTGIIMWKMALEFLKL